MVMMEEGRRWEAKVRQGNVDRGQREGSVASAT